MNDQNENSPRQSIFNEEDRPNSSVSRSDDPRLDPGCHGPESYPPASSKGVPVFHLGALVIILGASAWFWLGADAEKAPTPPGGIPEDVGGDQAGSVIFEPMVIENDRAPAPFSETKFVSTPAIPNENEPEISDEETPAASPAPQEDPATKLFEVVSRIRSSRAD
jgi:hypothetical protein